jgi:outer membrane protein
MRTKLLLAPLAASLLAAFAHPAAAADLLEIYRMSHDSDPVLQAADANRRNSDEGVVISRARLLPNINGTAGLLDVTGGSKSVTTVPQPDGSVSFGPVRGNTDTRERDYRVTLRQSIYNHGNWTALRSSRSLASKGEQDYQATLDALFDRVATAYFNALTARSNLDAANAQEKAVGRQLEQAEQRFEVGLTAITDVHEARAQHDAAIANQILLQYQLDDAFEALAVLTGKQVDKINALGDNLPLDPPEPNDQEAWVKLALDVSPQLAALRFAVQSAEHDVDTARSGHYPFVDAAAGYAKTSVWGDFIQNDFTFPATQRTEGNNVSVTLTVPIFNGLATQAGVRQALARRDAAADQLEQQVREVTRQVRNAYRAAVAGVSSVKARAQALVSAKSALEATQAGFEVGTRTIVDVLLSQQALFAAQRDYAQSRHLFLLSGLTLKQAAGTIELKDLEIVNTLLTASATSAHEY